ncbi:MAG: hypothetical protein FJY65_08925 [Calditrichaeota bacterium]|nr:hypothetical protein [Calditrichota bacterium]
MKIFVGGSRSISHLDSIALSHLERAIAHGHTFLIGDANGVDKAAQAYLYNKEYPYVEIYYSGLIFRNNIGSWTARQIETKSDKVGLDYYTAKDRIMAKEADAGLMIWDGKSAGTLMNVIRMIQMTKSVILVNVNLVKSFHIRTQKDIEEIITDIKQSIKLKVDRQLRRESFQHRIVRKDTLGELPLLRR